MDEDEILHWLLSHLENDEIEDIDEDTLERMIKEGRTMAVLFCKFIELFSIFIKLTLVYFNQMITTTRSHLRFLQNWRILMMNVINLELLS